MPRATRRHYRSRGATALEYAIFRFMIGAVKGIMTLWGERYVEPRAFEAILAGDSTAD